MIAFLLLCIVTLACGITLKIKLYALELLYFERLAVRYFSGELVIDRLQISRKMDDEIYFDTMFCRNKIYFFKYLTKTTFISSYRFVKMLFLLMIMYK